MSQKRHPIQVVARRAGLSPELLRAWEKRYAVVEPGRTPGGQRLYSDEDVQRLRLLRMAIQGGRRIGNVAGLGIDDLVALIEEDRGTPGLPTETREVPPGIEPIGSGAARVVDNAMDAALALDEPRLTRLLDRAAVLLPPEVLVAEILAPLMRRVGELWHEEEIRPAHEHLLSAVVRGVLSHLTASAQPEDAAHHVVVATPEGQRHEIGAMFAAVIATVAGWRVTYLGPDLPVEDIATVVQEAQAGTVALSLVHPEGDTNLDEKLRRLSELLPRNTEILAGGAAAESYRGALEAVGAVVMQDLSELGALLRERDGGS